MNLKRKIVLLIALVLAVSAFFSVVMISSSAAEGDLTVTIDGKNYTIAKDKIVADAGVAIFARKPGETTYTFQKTMKSSVIDSFTTATDILNTSYAGGEVYVLALKDSTETRTSGWNNGYTINGALTVDLGGNTISMGSTSSGFDGFIKACTK